MFVEDLKVTTFRLINQLISWFRKFTKFMIFNEIRRLWLLRLAAPHEFSNVPRRAHERVVHADTKSSWLYTQDGIELTIQ